MPHRLWLDTAAGFASAAHAESQSLNQISAEILRAALDGAPELRFLETVLKAVAAGLSAKSVALHTLRDDASWERLALTGTPTSITTDTSFLSDVADRGTCGSQDACAAAPLTERAVSGELLVVERDPIDQAFLQQVAEIALTVGTALQSVREREAERVRAARLEELLGLATRWYQLRDTEPLLVEIAEAATRLLAAERASVFLWDRPRRQLVGRPALGVPGGELRIPDNSGVVGRVVRSGQPERVSRRERSERIDQQVDKQLAFRTENLVCVPLRGAGGEMLGAFEVLNKQQGDFTAADEQSLADLAAHAAVAVANAREREQLVTSTRQITEQAAQGVRLIGQCPAIETLRTTIARVAGTELAVLILGENGTGKEVVAQSVHYQSPRRDRPFIAVNCAAISETLLESELFGHEKGAFTDAREARAGKFELAAGGTLFLDEIGDLSPGGQAKLLRVLEEKVVVRVGGSRTIPTDARVLAATNQPLAELVRAKRFRQDLFFRLNVVSLQLPALRERGADVLVLAEHFLAEFCARARRPALALSDAARQSLRHHDWPGNIRELRNLMERLAFLHAGETLEPADLGLDRAATTGGAPASLTVDRPLSEATDEFQRRYINEAIESEGGNVTEGAKRLGLHRSNLYRKMRQLGMQPPE